MSFPELGWILLILLAVVIAGNLWFHFVESLLNRIKGLFTRRKDPPAWHPLPSEQECRQETFGSFVSPSAPDAPSPLPPSETDPEQTG